MPYFISQDTECPEWAVVKEDDSVIACHDSKESAIEQMVALSLAEDIEPGGERKKHYLKKKAYRELRLESGPPAVIADIDGTLITFEGNRNDKVQDYLKSFNDTEIIIVTARLASERTDTVAQLQSLDINYSELLMKPNADTNSTDWKKEQAQKLLETYNVMVAVDDNKDIRTAYADLGITAISPESVPTMPANDIDQTEPDSRMRVLANSLIARLNNEESMTKDNKWLDVARAIALKIDGPQANEPEVRTNSVDFEVRAEGDGMTFTGYASVFNSPSEDLGGFIEYVAPGAFKRSLQSRNEVKLLWNHDSGEPLASLRGGTMQLVEDDRGLKVTATLPQTSRGKDVAELLRTKVIDSMSFGFNVIKDSWSRDGQTRTLESVRLFEVSIVSFPAYESTTAQVRSQPTINPDQLADALLKLESGEELDEESATLITEVVTKLKSSPEVEEVIDNGLDLLDLKKKQFDLLLKRI
jgi:HK97 family phage prohead protease